MGQLTETQIKAVKREPKESFFNDGGNLFLRARSTGKAWVYRYEKAGKTIKLGLGPLAGDAVHRADTVVM